MNDDNSCFLRKEDKLFKKANIKRDGPWGHAVIGPSERLSRSTLTLWDLYSMGYKRAADVSIENAGRDSHFLIYPIVFSYRQYIELRLKQIIVQGNCILDNSRVIPEYVCSKVTNVRGKAKTYYQIHKLDPLWNEAKETFIRLFPDSSPDELDAPECCIKQFSEIDRESYKYRYPVDTRGRSVYSSCETVSLKELKDVMNKLSFFLDGTCECILDMPAHGYFLPNQTKISEEQCRELWNLLSSSEKEWSIEEIQEVMEKNFKLKYSTEQIQRTLYEYANKIGEESRIS